jgi:NAD(P)-dependent dehydrogenase (short-subunit alcohol dehydrogenase family)
MPVRGRGEDEAWRKLIDSLPLQRAGGGAAVGEAVVYLARSDFSTGATLELDGGEHLLGPGGE